MTVQLALLTGVVMLLVLAVAHQHSISRHQISHSDLMGWRLSAFAETTEELLWEIDGDGTITYASQMATSMLGYSPADLIGRSCVALLVTDSDRDRKKALLGRSLQRQQGWTNERFTYRTKGGVDKELLSSALVRVDRSGTPIGFTGILREKTAQDGAGELTQDIRERVLSVMSGGMTAVFQPITSLTTGAMEGAEALTRFPDQDRRSPDLWFREATVAGLGVELEITALAMCLAEARRELSPDIYLSVNVSPEAVLSGRLLPLVQHCGWPSRQLVLEITEHVPITDYGCLTSRIDELRALGVRLAVDDAGAGFASFRHILRLRPDYIKLDRTLVDGIDDDPAKRALAGAVVAFGQAVGAVVVAEGIETAAELRTARMLGIQSGQGFFIGRPVAGADLQDPAVETALSGQRPEIA